MLAARASLFGEIFSPQPALELGIVNELKPAEEVVDRAVEVADLADPLDQELPDGMTHEQSRVAHRRYWEHLKGRPAPW